LNERYVLQIDDWGLWSNECSFNEPGCARNYARERYPHNNWRIWDSVRRRVVSESEVLHDQLLEERNRFQQFDRILESVEENNRRRERLGEIARRQRERDGLPPITVEEALQERIIVHESENFIFVDDSEDECQMPKVNWRKEGF
jgi:hypothetical protein